MMDDNVLIRLDHISKVYDKKYVIKNLSLDIYDGEFLTLLGPSGCGKTTVLRMISGLEPVTEGKVYLDGKDITNDSPTDRAVNTIFQNFALFPHMTVWENINFGLKMKKTPKSEAVKRIKHAISLVKLDGYENRFPHELSGGEQQRVAIARGIVMNHKVLLLDESLASLDLKLKREMQVELKKLQKKLKMTFIYVTHDQDEALTMSDRIAIIRNGDIEQLGTPKQIYNNPKTLFAADFIGESNIINGVIKKTDKEHALVESKEHLYFVINNNGYEKDDKVKLLIRPENVRISKRNMENSYVGTIVDYLYDGALVKLVVEVGEEGKTFKVTLFDEGNFELNDHVYIQIPKDSITVIGDYDE